MCGRRWTASRRLGTGCACSGAGLAAGAGGGSEGAPGVGEVHGSVQSRSILLCAAAAAPLDPIASPAGAARCQPSRKVYVYSQAHSLRKPHAACPAMIQHRSGVAAQLACSSRAFSLVAPVPKAPARPRVMRCHATTVDSEAHASRRRLLVTSMCTVLALAPRAGALEATDLESQLPSAPPPAPELPLGAFEAAPAPLRSADLKPCMHG